MFFPFHAVFRLCWYRSIVICSLLVLIFLLWCNILHYFDHCKCVTVSVQFFSNGWRCIWSVSLLNRCQSVIHCCLLLKVLKAALLSITTFILCLTSLLFITSTNISDWAEKFYVSWVASIESMKFFCSFTRSGPLWDDKQVYYWLMFFLSPYQQRQCSEGNLEFLRQPETRLRCCRHITQRCVSHPLCCKQTVMDSRHDKLAKVFSRTKSTTLAKKAEKSMKFRVLD